MAETSNNKFIEISTESVENELLNEDLKNLQTEVVRNVETPSNQLKLKPELINLVNAVSKAKTLEEARNIVIREGKNLGLREVFDNQDLTLQEFAEGAREGKNGGLLFGRFEISRGDPILKLLQIFLSQRRYSIMDGNKKSTMQSIDGDFRNDSMDALLSYQRDKSVDQKIEKERREQENRWIKGQVADFQYKLEKTGTANEQLRIERGLKVKVLPGSIDLTSYGYTCTYDSNTGVMAVDTAKGRQEFPRKIGLDRESIVTNQSNGDRQKAAKESILPNQSNGDRLKAVFGLMNLINRGRALSKKINDKSADNYKPFHLERNNIIHTAGRGVKAVSKLESIRGVAPAIEVQNGLNDLQLIKVIHLEASAKVLEISREDVANHLIQCLNAIHESDYRKDQNIRAGGSDGSKRF